MRAGLRYGLLFAVPIALWIASSRLPQTHGANGFLDGDESILALMALHAARGDAPGLFFYGQSFGLAIFEWAAVLLAFTLFGVSTAAVKGSMLALWSVGVAFFAAAWTRTMGGPRALAGVLLLVTCSAFAAWSTMARGYHVAAFTLMGLLVWQLARVPTSNARDLVAAASTGITAGLLFLTNAIWLLAALPFMACAATPRARARAGSILAGSACLVAGAGVIAAPSGRAGFWAPDFLKTPHFMHALLELPERLRVMFSGAYSYGTATPAGPGATISSWLWLAVTVVLSVHAVGSCVRRRASRLQLAALVSLISIVALSLVIDPRAFGFRYLLPAVPAILFLLLLFDRELESGPQALRRGTWVAAAVLVIAGAWAVLEAPPRRLFETLEPSALSEDRALAALVRDLEDSGIRHVYSLHPTLQWSILFYSRERVTARFLDPNDRLPRYPAEVDRAFRAGQPVALVGTARQWRVLEPMIGSLRPQPDVRVSGGRFFWISPVSEEWLERLGFRLRAEEKVEVLTKKTPGHTGGRSVTGLQGE